MYETWKGRWKVWSRGGSAHPPLLLLHGFTGDAQSFRPVIAEDANGLAGRTVVTLTLPGHEPPSRRSGLSHSVPDFERVVDHLAEDLKAIVPAPYHIVGYSMGARVALGLIVRHPELFAKATLISVHPGLEGPAERKKRAAEDQRWIEKLERGGVEAFVDAWEKRALFATQGELSASARGEQRAVRTSHTAEGLAWAMRVLGLAAQPSYWRGLFDLEVPIDIVFGAKDAKFARIAQRMGDLVPVATLFPVPDCGHNVILERPDVVSDLLTERTLTWQSSAKTLAGGKPGKAAARPPARNRV